MSKVHAVIVTYQPDVNIVSENVENLIAGQKLDAIHIVDNTPDGSELDLLKRDMVYIYSLDENKGIATAQNVGIQAALLAGADYIVLFDQDSELDVDLIAKLLASMEKAKLQGINLACIGPRPLDVFSGRKYRPVIQKEQKVCSEITLCSQIIASGKLIDASVLKKVGLMEEDLFIDGVDHEWCWRAKKYGYAVGIAENAVMEHTLGDARGKFMGISYKIGSAIRMYYQFRNILILSRRAYVPLYWKIRNIAGMFFRFYVFGFTRKDSSVRKKYMLQGIHDGFKNKLGPYRNN